MVVFFSSLLGLKERRSYLHCLALLSTLVLWWIFIFRSSQLLCEPSYHYMGILPIVIKIGPIVAMLTCKETSLMFKVILLLINGDQLLSIIGDYMVCCFSQKTKTWLLDASPFKKQPISSTGFSALQGWHTIKMVRRRCYRVPFLVDTAMLGMRMSPIMS